MLKKGFNKLGQVTIFIIIAIVLVGAVIGFFAFKDSLIGSEIPANMEPIYTDFLSCLEHYTFVGINVLESQAGYIYLPDFEQGSSYMPFSSQLDFLGNPVPYWYYVSGNNIQRENVPSVGNMESDIEQFIEEKINKCIFDKYYEQGFMITQGEPKASVDIMKDRVEVELKMNLGVEKGEESALVRNHYVVVNSNLGKLYESAIEIYDYEQDSLFLEEYAVDTLRLYAPVDGVEMTCAPKVWNADDVFDELQIAIEENTKTLKTKGGSYSLTKNENKYFVVDVSIDEDVRFLNSKDWPNSLEVAPTDGSVMIANPVGNQPGLGILGFCYVPYHFVYNVRYPVLVQIFSGDEIFQFPLAVVVQGNKQRKALDGASAVDVGVPDFCKHKNTLTTVRTYDRFLDSVNAEVSYECSGTICSIGKTESGVLETEFPQCANGFVLVRADGYKDTRQMYSTTSPGDVDIILDKLYELEIDLDVGGKDYNGDAIVSFVSDDFSKTIFYPSQKKVNLSAGQYEVQVQIYRNSSLRLEGFNKQQCIEVPKEGIGTLFGLTEEKCFDIQIPSQVVSNALSGGGKQNYYILDSELEDSEFVQIDAVALPLPTTLEQLQENYQLYEEQNLEIYFR